VRGAAWLTSRLPFSILTARCCPGCIAVRWSPDFCDGGNACDAAKQAADYVTDDIMKDGLSKALEHFGLI